jgi:hypothetical protein
MRFTRLLRNRSVTAEEMSRHAGALTGGRVAGRDVVAIQDTSELALGGRRAAAAGYGIVGKGGAVRGLLLHPVLAVEAGTGALLGLVSLQVWNRPEGMPAPRRQRETQAKESQRWIDGAREAGAVLSQARSITAVSDRGKRLLRAVRAPSRERRADRAGLPEPAHRDTSRRGRGLALRLH